ncbi:dolichyl-phosphate beta-D-mannosyltransferase, partial [Halobacteriales archaeon QS_6_71_20]
MERRRSLDELPVDRDLYARPAIGLLATPRNADAIAASVLRAQRDGYHVLVASRRGDSEAASFARTLGATLVSTGDPEADSRPPREQLALVARNQGHPGLVYHDDPEARIDFSASEETLLAENRFVVDAEVESPVSPEPTVLAGIPAYNEGTTIEPLVAATRRHADDVIVVDDGSDDDTAEAAEAAGATVIGHETNRGYGAALKTIFEAADSSR